MRTAITIGIRRKGGSVILTDTNEPLRVHRQKMKEVLRTRAHAEFSEVILFTSDGGGSMRKRFVTPERAAAFAAANVPPVPDEAPEIPTAPPEAPAPEPKRGRK